MGCYSWSVGAGGGGVEGRCNKRGASRKHVAAAEAEFFIYFFYIFVYDKLTSGTKIHRLDGTVTSWSLFGRFVNMRALSERRVFSSRGCF